MKHLLALVLLLAAGGASAAPATTPDRIEPPFWWPGMKEPDLQLMLHGEAIGNLQAAVDYPGVEVVGTESTANPNYLFINLRLAPDVKPGTFPIQLLENGTRRSAFDYQLRARTAPPRGQRGFDSTDAIYLVTPDRFANGDAGNDIAPGMQEGPDREAPGGRHGGDIAGMRAALEYIANMGFTAIWPNPLLENNQPAYSYHGYSATDHYRIDPRFGSNEEYREFVAAAGEKGIGVIQDVVLNHIGDGHWWMTDLPDTSWLNGAGTGRGEYAITNHSRFTPVDPHASEADQRLFTEGWFVDSMPDLNQRHPLLANYLIQNTLWWIEYAGISGIRADTYAYSDPGFLEKWAGRIRREYPGFNIVGEEWTRNAALVAHWQRGEREPATGGRLQSMMDFPLHYALREGLTEKESWSSGLIRLYEGLANDFQYPNPERLVIFGGNHDTSRLFSQLGEDLALFRMAVAYLATMRGIPQFFYGDELLMTSPRHRADGIVRSDFPGGWNGDKANGFTGAGLTDSQRKAQAYVRALFRWRRTQPVIHRGQLTHFAPVDGPYVYFRHDNDNVVMVAMNKGDKPAPFRKERFAEIIGGKNRGVDVVSGRGYQLNHLQIPPREVMVLEIQ
ncbi:glycoside hydrolase family 13 protein [Microbulbifer yueqingensis]|uniref:Glycosidase n=1 Tax=Microbulbifer yueqingensis TaxID=658219 RepID=A0A1G8Y7U0_9GAMM|nr:glycoside hydrolase family 13 protein [Microbulbifer yueqingensis]SDJ98858.1 Glycosidase [Microbulbifer yueqingensis]